MNNEPRMRLFVARGIRILRWIMPIAIAGLLLLILSATGLATPLGPQADTALRIVPASQNLALGHTVTTDVMVEDVANLYTIDIRLSFDPLLVEALDVEPGGFLSADWQLQKTIDNDNGLVVYAISQLRPTEPVTGSGPLATITWRGVAQGTSPISFTHQELYQPGGGAPIPATTQDGELVVVIPAALPTITALDPSAVPVGSPAFTLTVGGANFIADSVVLWDGEPRPTTYVATTTLTADIAAADVAAAGTVEVQVANSPDPDDRSNAMPLDILNPVPQVTALSPVSATVGAPAFTLTVRGANYVAGSTVHWGGQPRPTTVVSATEVAAHIAAADLAAPGSVAVTVVNPAPGGGPSDPVSFTVAPAEPGPDAHAVYLPLVVSGGP